MTTKLAQMFGFTIRKILLMTLTQSLPGLQRNLHPEMRLICIRLLCFQHDHVVCSFHYGEYF